MTLWHTGQKVVCIWNKWTAQNGETCPQKGSIYTIENIVEAPDKSIGFELCEIINAPRRYDSGFGECNFASPGFRPLLKRKAKTDISELKKLLAPKHKERKHEPA